MVSAVRCEQGLAGMSALDSLCLYIQSINSMAVYVRDRVLALISNGNFNLYRLSSSSNY